MPWRWDGSRRRCSAALTTTAAMSSRCAPTSWRNGVKPRIRSRRRSLSPISITTARPAGPSTTKGRSSMSTRKLITGCCPLRSSAAPSRRRRNRPVSASRSPKPTSSNGTSPFCPTAPICRPAAARRRKAQKYSPKNEMNSPDLRWSPIVHHAMSRLVSKSAAVKSRRLGRSHYGHHRPVPAD